MKILAVVFLIVILLTSCATNFGLEILNIELTDGDSIFQNSEGPGARVFGYMKVEVKAGREALEDDAASGVNVWFRAKLCRSGIDLDVWPDPIRSTSGSYYLLIAYKRDLGRVGDVAYNIAKSPENLCLTLGRGSMNPFVSSKLSMEYYLDQKVLNDLISYDRRDGRVLMKFPAGCEFRSCIP